MLISSHIMTIFIIVILFIKLSEAMCFFKLVTIVLVGVKPRVL